MAINQSNVDHAFNATILYNGPDMFTFVDSYKLAFLFLLVSLVFISDVAVGIAMRHVKNMTFSTKLYTCLSLLFDSIVPINLLAIFVVRSVYGMDVYFISITTFIIRIVTALSWVTVTLLLIDKVVCFYYPIDYLKNASSTKIVLVTICAYCGVICIQVLARFLLKAYFDNSDITINTLREDKPILTFILGVCLSLDCLSYIAICNILKRQTRRISVANMTTSNQLRNSRTIIVIFAVFMIVHVPLFLILVYADLTSHGDYHRYAALLAMLVVCFINPILYAWRIRECRYLLLAFLSRGCPCLRQRTEAMRHEVYNIVTVSRLRPTTSVTTMFATEDRSHAT